MKTFSIKPSELQKKWILIDADGVVLGRLAAKVATILRGKEKPTYTPHMDMGDNVIIVNAEKVHLTGKKRDTKTYYWHTGYPGGLKTKNFEKMLKISSVTARLPFAVPQNPPRQRHPLQTHQCTYGACSKPWSKPSSYPSCEREDDTSLRARGRNAR